MKKQLLIISVLVVMVGIFVSCSANGGSEDISTTAVTDSNGATYYYVPVTDENGEAVTNADGDKIYAEIETQADGTAVTDKSGEFVTDANTTALAGSGNYSAADKEQPSSGNQSENADNEVPFDPAEESSAQESKTQTTSADNITTETNQTEKTTQSATDADGWINKWY